MWRRMDKLKALIDIDSFSEAIAVGRRQSYIFIEN